MPFDSAPRRAARGITFAVVVALAAAAPSAARAQRGRGADTAAIAAVKAKYRKIEVRIPMRDGVKLFTSIYVPRDTSRRYPILMDAHAVRRRRRTVRDAVSRVVSASAAA